VQLVGGKPVAIKLDGGSRTTLAPVSEELNALPDARLDTTGAALTGGVSGIGIGFGTAGSALAAPTATTGDSGLPVVVQATEKTERGVAGDVRAVYKLNPDRKT